MADWRIGGLADWPGEGPRYRPDSAQRADLGCWTLANPGFTRAIEAGEGWSEFSNLGLSLKKHEMDTRAALMASKHAVAENPLTMALWAVFIVLYPLMGHTYRRVYRDLVEGSPAALSRSVG